MTGHMFMTRQEVKLFYNPINQYFPCPKKKKGKKNRILSNTVYSKQMVQVIPFNKSQEVDSG